MILAMLSLLRKVFSTTAMPIGGKVARKLNPPLNLPPANLILPLIA